MRGCLLRVTGCRPVGPGSADRSQENTARQDLAPSALDHDGLGRPIVFIRRRRGPRPHQPARKLTPWHTVSIRLWSRASVRPSTS
jgi:hypothetical protein